MALPNELEIDTDVNAKFVAWKKWCEITIDSVLREAPVPIQGAYFKYWIGASVPVTKKWNSTISVNSTSGEISHELHKQDEFTDSCSYYDISESSENDYSTKEVEMEKKCYRCGKAFLPRHVKKCKANNAKCNHCGITGHFEACCQKKKKNKNSTGKNYSSK